MIAEQLPDPRRDHAGAQVGLGHLEPVHVVHRQVHAALLQVHRHVTNDVRQLQRHPQVDGVIPGGLVAVAEDLHADEANRGGDAVTVLEQRLEVGIPVIREVHLHAVDQGFELEPWQVELPDERLQRLTLSRGRVPSNTSFTSLRQPASDLAASARASFDRSDPRCESGATSSTASSTARQKSHTATMA